MVAKQYVTTSCCTGDFWQESQRVTCCGTFRSEIAVDSEESRAPRLWPMNYFPHIWDQRRFPPEHAPYLVSADLRESALGTHGWDLRRAAVCIRSNCDGARSDDER